MKIRIGSRAVRYPGLLVVVVFALLVAPATSFAAITVGTYPFTALSSVSLEDMNSGTTELLPGNVDDNSSSVTNIGFEFWYDGVRFTQFSVNASS